MVSKRLLLVSPLVFALGACGTGSGRLAASNTNSPPPATAQPAAAHHPQQATTAPACQTGRLSLRLGSGGGAAGSVYDPLIFTNTGTSACTLRGYPGVSFVAPQTGKQVGAAATRNPEHAVVTVTLAAGGSASALVQIVNYSNYDPSACTATTVSGLRVYAPGNTAAAYVAFAKPQQACSTTVHQLAVEAVVAGTTGGA